MADSLWVAGFIRVIGTCGMIHGYLFSPPHQCHHDHRFSASNSTLNPRNNHTKELHVLGVLSTCFRIKLFPVASILSCFLPVRPEDWDTVQRWNSRSLTALTVKVLFVGTFKLKLHCATDVGIQLPRVYVVDRLAINLF